MDREDDGTPSGLWGPTEGPGPLLAALAGKTWTVEIWLNLAPTSREAMILDLGQAYRPGFSLGHRGKFFDLIKFRSMRSNAEEVLRNDPLLQRTYIENDFKLPENDDPRVTRLGRFLRRTSLDELPQLLNVLVGDMSLVGPRPLVGPELEKYGSRIPTLLSVKPGMTGRWQVSGRSSIPYPERAEMDLEYVRNWSFLGDLWILALTLPAVLIRNGAH